MAQSVAVCRSGHKTVKVVLHMDIRRKKKIFVRQRKLLGDSFSPHPVSNRRFPQGSLFHNQEVEEGFWVNCSDTQCNINPL